MKILFGKCFGIGNVVMALPTLKALHSLGHEIDVLVGTLPDDGGAVDVIYSFKEKHGCVDKIFRNGSIGEHDIAIMSIPFDGRWRNGEHFRAKEVWDGRTRPDPSTTGLSSWKRHEIEYQMDAAYRMGFVGEIPSCDFFPVQGPTMEKTFYFGLGYKKDPAGFWKQKHWGNENYAALAKMILDADPENRIVTTGDLQDMVLSIAPIRRLLNDDKRFTHLNANLMSSFDYVSRCPVYVGNDTGMMHVAAAAGNKVLGLFFLENSIVKSRPWNVDGHVIDGFGRTVTPEEVFKNMRDKGWV